MEVGSGRAEIGEAGNQNAKMEVEKLSVARMDAVLYRWQHVVKISCCITINYCYTL